ncbi:hypothetical protein HPB50_009976 [Hyalomma asiaticum]|uniref:Uncharacterized protein n=1 Tax=Hyalomma asiaticum TaxID=266040 RepID=A0ACB7S2R1_HYAAI|nr:hypothetical protein HPB50_009976 [Hyalomma asiaticum]
MPRDRYKTLSSGTPTEALAIPKPFGATSQRIRDIAVRITRSCTFKRPSHGDEEPVLNEEQDSRARSSSSSSSTSSLQPSGRTRLYPPAQPEIDPSPSWTPKGCLVFVDSSAEFENDRHVAPPEECSARLENTEEAPTGDFEADEQARGSSPSNATRSGCLDPLSASSSGPTCRVCGLGSTTQGSLVPVCKCQDTTGLLHASCLERRLSARNGESPCEACHGRFGPAVEFSTARLLYRWVLFGEPHSQRALLGDLLLLALLTPVAVLSCLLCVRGASKRLMLGDVAQAAGLVTLAVFFTAAYVVWTFFRGASPLPRVRGVGDDARPDAVHGSDTALRRQGWFNHGRWFN